MIYDAFPTDQVEAWAINVDAGLDWLEPFRQEHDLHLPIMRDAVEAFDAFRLGRAFRTWPPLYIIIDKNGVIRHRSLTQGSISLEEVAQIVEELLEE